MTWVLSCIALLTVDPGWYVPDNIGMYYSARSPNVQGCMMDWQVSGDVEYSWWMADWERERELNRLYNGVNVYVSIPVWNYEINSQIRYSGAKNIDSQTVLVGRRLSGVGVNTGVHAEHYDEATPVVNLDFAGINYTTNWSNIHITDIRIEYDTMPLINICAIWFNRSAFIESKCVELPVLIRAYNERNCDEIQYWDCQMKFGVKITGR